MSGAVPPVKVRDPWMDYAAIEREREAAEAARRRDWKLRTTWWQRHEAQRLANIADEKRKTLLGSKGNLF
jgi:hypothetical protein